MPEALPIACALSAAEFPARLAQMAALGREALVDTRITGARARLHSRPTRGYASAWRPSPRPRSAAARS